MPCAYAPFAGVAGVCYSRGEVPTTVGQTYWVVYEREGGGGFNVYRMNEGNVYGDGTAAYYAGGWHGQSFDLWMNLYEYKIDLNGDGKVDFVDFSPFARQWLKAGVMEEGTVRHTALGTPQGGVISPLLANIYLDYLDSVWE